MTNRELRTALLNKLKITQQALSLRVKKIKSRNPMTTEEATYLIAHREGIILDKYLDKEAVANIRRIQQDISQVQPTLKPTINKKKESVLQT